jgi:FtsZ-binding cell division protein ZapB
MGTVETIRGIIKDFFAVDALRDKTLLLQKEVDALLERNVYLEEKVADIERKYDEAKKEITQLRSHDDFTEYRGAKFKRLPQVDTEKKVVLSVFIACLPCGLTTFFPSVVQCVATLPNSTKRICRKF